MTRRRSDASFVERFAHVINDRLEGRAVRGVLAEHLFEQRRVREDVEHEVYPGDALVREVVHDELLQEVSALVDVLDEEHLVKREVHLEETDHRFNDRVELDVELKRGQKMVLFRSMCLVNTAPSHFHISPSLSYTFLPSFISSYTSATSSNYRRKFNTAKMV